MKWPDHDLPPACRRLHAWLNSQDTLHVKYLSDKAEPDPEWFRNVADKVRRATNPLLWLESCDVETTRSAVKLAERTGATLHVAASPGEHLISVIMSSIGWQGTTLAEVKHAARLVVHIGHEHLSEMPLLLSRFASDACEHLFLGHCPSELKQEERASNGEVIELNWPRSHWLDGLMRALLAVRDDSRVGNRLANAFDAQAGLLAEKLLSSRYTVILFSQSEFTDAADRLIVERLVDLVDVVGQITRCTLLPLASDPGRVTAHETVLWLTNRLTPIRFSQGKWQVADHSAGLSLDQWQSLYDIRFCIRSLPSDRPLPELAFHFAIEADCNRGQFTTGSTSTCYVNSLAIGSPGHLTRGDHGLAAYTDCLDREPSRMHAWEALDRIRQQTMANSDTQDSGSLDAGAARI